MFKRIFLCIALVMPFLASAQNVKIGLVDVNEIIANMPDTQAAQTRIKEASDKYEAEYQKLQDEFNRKYEEYTKQGESALPAIRQRMESELTDYQTKIQQFAQSAQQDLQNLQGQLMAPILQKVRDAISSIGKEGNYTIVQALDDAVFYYSAPAEDITPQVKTRLGIQ